ncbi:MAG: hypothetical protein AAFO15_00820 [Pseudomonadota bacterium]
MNNAAQIIILLIILICLIIYFLDIVGSEEYNSFETNHTNNNTKYVPNLANEEYTLKQKLTNIPNFDINKFQTISCKIIKIILNDINEKKIQQLKNFINKELLLDIESSIQNNIIALIAHNPIKNQQLNQIIKNNITINHINYLDVSTNHESTKISSQYKINEHIFIFTFIRQNHETHIWLLQNIT